MIPTFHAGIHERQFAIICDIHIAMNFALPRLTSLTLLIVVVVKTAAQEPANYVTAEQLQRDVTLLLLEKNIDHVTKQLDSETPSIASLLRRLVIYGRAGQTSRVRSNLRQLS